MTLSLNRTISPLLIFLAFLSTASCHKAAQSPAFTVDNTWQCEVDGISYSGTIDTSFIQVHPGEHDTLITCNGTSADKKANIHFQFDISRSSNTGSSSPLGYLLFDTSSTHLLQTNYASNLFVTYQVEAFADGKLKASFSGAVMDLSAYNGPQHRITNGKFSCAAGQGDSEPKTFSFTGGNIASGGSQPVNGYFNNVRLLSNSLIMDGISNDGNKSLRLIAHTGGSLKTGTYSSKDGNASMQYFVPSIYADYVTDSLGDMTLTINTVTGNIVEGSFSGKDADGTAFTNGKFICRVKNYQPQADSLNKWLFCEDEYSFKYRIFGGNVLNATRSQSGSIYYLTINGESDNGSSHYSLSVSDYSLLTTGTYAIDESNSFNKFSYFHFTSPAVLRDGDSVSIKANYGPFYCRIDSLDDHKAVGILYGGISIYNYSTVSYIRTGRFRATF